MRAVVVTAASVQDREGAKTRLEVLRHHCARRRLLGAEGADAGARIERVWSLRPWRKVRRVMTQRSDTAQGFTVLPTRWLVERTPGWCNRDRRVSKDDEFLPQTSATVIRVVMIHFMVRCRARAWSY